MTDIRLTSSGDIDFTTDEMVLISGVEAVAQDISVRLQLFKGEWFRDTRIGIPYYEKILGEKPRIGVIKSIFQQAILAVPGMISISDLQLEYTGSERKLTVTFYGVCESGDFQYNEEMIFE